MSWPIRVTAQLPATIAVGHPVTDARVSATVTMPAEVTAMLYRIGQRFVDGRAMAQAHVGSSHELTVPMSVPQTPVPASGAATFTASGVAEAFTAAEPGSADVIAGGFSAALRSSATADMAQSYKVTLACTPSSAVSLGSMTAVAGPAPSPPNPNVTPAPPAPNATTTAPPAPPVPPNQPAAGDPGLKNVTVDWADSYSSKLVIRADARTAGTVQIGTYSADRTMLSDTTWTITAAGSQSFTLDVPDKTTHVSLSWGQNGASNWQLGDSTSAPTSSPTPSASPTTTTANGKIVPIAGAASSPVVPARVQTG